MNPPQTRVPLLLDAREVAGRLSISVTSWRRLVDRRAAPEGVRLGRLRRWDWESVSRWVSDGCPDLRRRRSSAGGASC